jgi:hypothetical protein
MQLAKHEGNHATTFLVATLFQRVTRVLVSSSWTKFCAIIGILPVTSGDPPDQQKLMRPQNKLKPKIVE